MPARWRGYTRLTGKFAHRCAQGPEDGAPRDCREVRARAQGHPLGAREAAPLFYGLFRRRTRGSHVRRRPDGRLELIVRGTASEKLLAIDAPAAASRRRFTHTGTSTSSRKASPSRPSSRARARSRTRSTRTSSRRLNSRHNHPFLSVCCCYHRHLPPPSSKHDHHNTARATGTVTRGLGSKAKFTILFVASPPTTPARAPHRQRRRRPLGRRRRPPFGWRSRSKRHSLHRRQSC